MTARHANPLGIHIRQAQQEIQRSSLSATVDWSKDNTGLSGMLDATAVAPDQSCHMLCFKKPLANQGVVEMAELTKIVAGCGGCGD